MLITQPAIMNGIHHGQMDNRSTPSRLLYRVTVVSFVVSAFLHALAVFAALGIMQPGLDVERATLERATYVAENVWLWRVGWHLWQLVGLSNLVAAILLVCYFNNVRQQTGLRIKLPWMLSLGGLVFTIIAIVPEQWGEFAFVSSFVDRAREAVRLGDASVYVRWEARWILLTTACGAFGYTLMQACWSVAVIVFHRNPGKIKGFITLSIIDFIGFMLSVYACHHACAPVLEGQQQYADFHYIAICNGIAFPVLFIWMLAFTATLGDRHHQFFTEDSDPLHEVKLPNESKFRWLAPWLNSPGVRDVFRMIGKVVRTPVLHSNIRNVLYLNWLVPTERVSSLLPQGMEVDSRDGKTAVSILTYQHGGFGPRILGPLRRCLPSPFQSNWRLYLKPEAGKEGSIYFVKTCLSSFAHVIGSRLMSDGLPSHMTGDFKFSIADRQGHLLIDSMGGSAPDLDLVFELSEMKKGVSAAWASRFGDWNACVDYLVSQNRAVDSLCGWASHLESLIDIPINVADAVPVQASITSSCELLTGLLSGEEDELFAFLIPEVDFRFLGEVVTDHSVKDDKPDSE